MTYLSDGGIVDPLRKHWTSIVGVVYCKSPSVGELQSKKIHLSETLIIV